MEPELERNRSGKHGIQNLRGRVDDRFTHLQSETIKKGQLEGVLERKTYAQETNVVVGIMLMVVGLVGFVVDNILGMHLSLAHNSIYILSGALLTWFGFKSETKAKRYSLIFGAFYGVLGVLGFIVGQPGMPTIGSLRRDDSLWLLSRDYLQLGTMDHVIHLVLAAVLIAAPLIKFTRIRRENI